MYPSNQGTLNTSPIPGSKAFPLDQGDSNTCTCHAVANAVAEQLEDEEIDIDQNFLAKWLVANNQTIGPVWPHFFDNYPYHILVQNRNNGEWISLKLTVSEAESFSNTDKHVLAYYTHAGNKPQVYHCVYVSQKSEKYYSCVNSWKDYNPYPEVDLDRPGNRLWRVRAEVKPPPKGWCFVADDT